MYSVINVSDELKSLSKELLETIEREDLEYDFKKKGNFVERNIPAFMFKKRRF